jgi:hypothetical protein
MSNWNELTGGAPSIDRRPELSRAHAQGSGLSSSLLAMAGLQDIWSQTQGDPRVCVAILDGPADLLDPSLRDANFQQLDGPAPARCEGPACEHGMQVARILFGWDDGLAPLCRGVMVPIFEAVDEQSLRACSQLDLARALTQAVLAGAHVINVSGGQLSPTGTAHPLLADVVRHCARAGVLIVAAAGNDGCECLHVPAALESVLAVGALDAVGEPLAFSNWGGPYQTQGILALGSEVASALRGTSYATAVVSGVAALLLSLQVQRGQRLDPLGVRAALLAGAKGRRRGRYLAGALDIRGALSILTRRHTMSEANEVQASDLATNGAAVEEAPASVPRSRLPDLTQSEESARPRVAPRPAEAKPAGCGCGAAPQLVYVLGQVGYDFRSEARLDSLAQKMASQAGIHPPERGLAFDPRRMLAHLEKNPWDAAAIEWTLSLDGTALYAIRPVGPFGADSYLELRRFLKERLDEGVERVSVPGVMAGKATLLNGQSVPVIVPELRGMYSWTTAALVDAVAGPIAAEAGAAERDGHAQKREGVRNFLARVYHELRNLGLTPQDRALNFAATNAFEMGQIYADAIRERMALDEIRVVPSPVGRPGSECWDVEVYFFYPERQVQTVRKVYRFTVDVSDSVPVTVGGTRAWFTR